MENEEYVIKKFYFENKEVNEAFIEYLKFRKDTGIYTNEYIVKYFVKKLMKQNNSTRLEMINQSLSNNWKDIYELENPIIERHNFDNDYYKD